MTTLVIGGGWSGLAAAITLVQQGQSVHLIEAASQLGGRARTVPWGEIQVDNGQHLMIGAYTTLLSLMQDIGVDEDTVFQRQALELVIRDSDFDELHLSANSRFLPWRLAIARSLIRSVGWKGLVSVVKLALSIGKLKQRSDISVAQWLQQTGQSTRLIKQLWEPLCLGALNTPIETASAQLFAEVIRLSLLQNKQAADLLIPIQPLSEVLPTPAISYLQQHSAQISLGKRVTELQIKDQHVTGVTLADGEVISAERVILATPVSQTQRLLNNHLKFPAVEHLPITTVYLRYANAAKLRQPMLGMSGTLAQWVFSRQDLAPGLIAVVISGPGEHEHLSQQALVDVIKAELAQCFAELNETVLDSLVIREKRATFAANAGIEALRPHYQSEIENLWLCGDFCHNLLPATLEGAVLNGRSCAQQIVASTGRESL